MYWANYSETAILNTFREITATASPQVYAGLMSVAPTGSSDGTEIFYSGYQRQIINFSAPTQNASLFGQGVTGMVNINEVTFPMITTDSGTAVGIGIYNTMQGGNLLAYATVPGGIALDENEEVYVKSGSVVADIKGTFSDYFNEKCLNYLRGENINGFKAYAGLSTSNVEFNGDTYERQAITFSTPVHASNEASEIKNSSQIDFPEPTQDWGLLAKQIICDSATGGNIISSKEILNTQGEPITKLIKRGYTIKARVGKLVVSVN